MGVLLGVEAISPRAIPERGPQRLGSGQSLRKVNKIKRKPRLGKAGLVFDLGYAVRGLPRLR